MPTKKRIRAARVAQRQQILQRYNIELSCAAASAQPEPTVSTKLPHNKKDPRRQLQRFVSHPTVHVAVSRPILIDLFVLLQRC